MAFRYIGAGVKEISQSLIPQLQVQELQKYIPDITVADVSKGPAGVRAQVSFI
jgi:2-hydroxyglutarate dehydrogenase